MAKWVNPPVLSRHCPAF